MNEIWKTVPGYEGLYEASNGGQIRSLSRKTTKGKILNSRKNKYGYFQVTLCKNGKTKMFSVHRLVWEAFNGPIAEGIQVNHINEDKNDNRLENLNLMSAKENVQYSQAKSVLCYDKNKKLVQKFNSIHDAEKWLRKPGARRNIVRNLKGKYSSAYGYVWEYA